MTTFLLAWAAAAAAQTTTATIEGSVFDATGAVLPAVAITIHGDTISRSVESDGRGFYRALALPPGRYLVAAELTGFQAVRVEGIDVALNRTATVDLRMEVAPQVAAIEVRPFTMLIDPTRSSISHVVTAQQIDSLPVNGRDYLDLVLLTPGAIVNLTARAPFGDGDTRGAILGERAGNAAFLIDGFENNDDFHGGVFQAYTQDAIQEFEVIASGYKAEFGRGSGGVVNAITRSGTNRLKGSGFFFLRNDRFDASTVPDTEAPDLSRANWGATLGGPVTRNRSWYFGSVEHLAERRQSIFPMFPAVLIDGEDFSKRPETVNTRLFGKYSRMLGMANDLATQASWSRLQNLNELASAAALPSASNDNDTRTFLGAVAYRSVIGGGVMLESAAGYREQRFGQNQTLGDGFNQRILIDGRSFDFNPQYGSKQTLDQHYITAREVASLFVSERHAAKAGVEYVRTSIDGSNGQGLSNVIVTNAANLLRFGKDSFQIPQGVGFIKPGDELSRLRNHGISLFAQDDWRLGARLTLNLGVRYDYDSKFDDTSNLAPRLGVIWAPDHRTAFRANWGIFYDRYRLGIAQAVPELGGFNGRTVLELNYPRLAADARPGPGRLAALPGGPLVLHNHFGIREDAIVKASNIQELTGLTPVQFLSELNTFLASLGTFLPVDFSPSTGYLRQDLSAAYQDQVRVSTPFKTPYNRTFSLGAERTLPGDLSLDASYVHRAIRNILGVQLTNLSTLSRGAGIALTTDGGPLQRSYGSWYDGDYDALILSLDKRFNGRYQVQVSYTHARGQDNLMNANLGLGVGAQSAGAVPTDNFNLEFDRGNSDLLVPDALVTSGIGMFPAGFSVSGVFRGTSGSFFSASSSQAIDYDGDGITSSRPEGTRRNQFRGPKTFNADLRIEKRFTIGRYTASALVEWFNLLNASNPKLIDNGYTSTGSSETFGGIRNSLPGRETQFGFRLTF